MTIYSLDVLLFLFGTSLLFHVQIQFLLPDLHTGFSRGRSGVWYSHIFQNFPQFIVIHTVKDFGIVNKAEVDVFLLLSCFFNDPLDVGNLVSGSSAFSKTSLNIWKFTGKKSPRFQEEILKLNRTDGKGKLYRKQKTDSTEEPATIFLCTWQVSLKTEDFGRV